MHKAKRYIKEEVCTEDPRQMVVKAEWQIRQRRRIRLSGNLFAPNTEDLS